MRRSVKFAVSIPDIEFQKLEMYRKKEGVTRSKLVLEAITYWKEAREKEQLLKSYKDGYRKNPENPKAFSGWEKAAMESFSKGEW
jgi:metal-responsive CopG/Arc/MetJ family transcriptional regulator